MSGFRNWLAGEASDVTVLGGKVILTIRSSQVWTAPADMEVLVRSIGGGGSGGLVYNDTQAGATGGGAGGMSVKKIQLKAGDTLDISIGAGAEGVSRPTSGSGAVNGNTGGTTEVEGPGIALQAFGGKGGKAAVGVVAVLSGEGGGATGGDANRTGGRGGNIPQLSGPGTITNARRTTGGGAVNFFAPHRGGDLLATSVASGNHLQASCTGGGGVFANGVDLNHAGGSAGDTPYAAGAGGSSGPLSPTPTAAAVTLRTPFLGLFDVVGPQGYGYINSSGSGGTNGPLTGSPGHHGVSANSAAGFFCGGGGISYAGSNNLRGSDGGIGGGGGGGVATSSGNGTYTAISGPGGTGLVFLEFLL